jgi:outer membrane lipoprotein-sorting protein
MWTLLRLLFVFLLLLPGQAKASDWSPISNEKLREKSARARKAPPFSVEFVQIKKFHDIDLTLQSTGQVEYVGPDDFSWRIFTPSPLLIRVQGKRITIQRKDATAQTVPSSEMRTKHLARLAEWIRFDTSEILNSYRVLQKGNIYRFLPMLDDDLFERIDVELNDSGTLKKVTLRERSKDHIEITFQNH